MEKWICPACKEMNYEHEKYCFSCGTWLLSTTFPAKSGGKARKADRAVSTVNDQKGLQTFYVIEGVLLFILSFLIWAGRKGNPPITDMGGIALLTGLILFGTSILLVLILLIKRSYTSNKKSIKSHFFTSIFFTIIGIAMFIIEPGNHVTTANQPISVPTLEQYQSKALQLEYRDLTRNAETKYKGAMVHFKGKLYHLVNGKQNYVMINVSNDNPSTIQDVISVTRADDVGTLLVGDIVDVYGTVEGTTPVKNILGAESIVPSIESHYITLISD